MTLAKEAVELKPQEGRIGNTLGTALYRAGRWKEGIETLEKANQLAGGKHFSFNAFFLAMAHWQLGDKGEARKWHDRAVDWTDALRRLRASRVRTTLAPAVRRLRPGARVLLVAPRFGHPDSPWTRTIAHRERHWLHWLERNRRLVELGAYVPTRYASRATVAGVLFERKLHAKHSLTT